MTHLLEVHFGRRKSLFLLFLMLPGEVLHLIRLVAPQCLQEGGMF